MTPANSMGGISDPLSRALYEAELRRHLTESAPALDRLDVERSQAESHGDRATVDRLRTMRTLLESGLFDRDFYLRTYDDVQQAGIDPLRHYVWHGDAEGRNPNLMFSPTYYREYASGAVPTD